MALNYYYALYKLKKAIDDLDNDLEKWDEIKNPDTKHEIILDIANARISLSDIKRCIDNWYLGGI